MAKQEYVLKIVLDDGELKVKIPDVVKSTNDLSKSFEKATKENEKFAKSVKKTKKVNEDLIKDSGLAGATLTEFGRTISDLPFGIQGVANNLSQLSTLFITLVSKSKEGGSSIDGFRKAFSRLRKQLMGPLGIILAFQSIIALLDFFSRRTKKAEEDLSSFNDVLSKNILISEQFQKLLDDSNLSLTERERLLQAASNRHNQLQKILSDETLTQEERNRRAEEFLDLENNRLLLTRESQKEEKQLFASRDNLTKIQTELNNATAEHNKQKEISGDFDEGFVTNLDNIIKLRNQEEEAQKELNLVTKAFINFQQQLAIITKEQNELLKSNTEDKKDNKKATEDLKEAEEAFLMDLKGIRNEARSIQLQELKTIESEEITSLSKRGLTRSEFEEEQSKIIQKFKNEEINLIRTILLADTLTTEERLKLRQRLALLTRQTLSEEQEGTENLLDGIMRRFAEVLEFADFATSAIGANIDAEISAEERKTQLINNELKKRMLNENLSAQQKRALNNQIARNEADLQEKRDKLAERQFKLQKAISIGQALINTYEMATRAYNAVLAGPEKFLGISALVLAKVAAGVATAFGLAQVNAISKQQFVPSGLKGATTVAGLGGTTGGTGVGTQDPAFNIVGTGQQFQLSQAIAQRTGEPVKAYVVTSDVRSGISLERNIIKGSKLG